jgi:hypothetical protein
MSPRDSEADDGLTTCLECGLRYAIDEAGNTPTGRCPLCEEVWRQYRKEQAHDAPDPT